MRFIQILLICFITACRSQEDQLRSEYFTALERWTTAYSGSDAALAYKETTTFLAHVRKLADAGAPIPAQEIYVWDTARLGLLAEHLGKNEEAVLLFATASENSKKTHGDIQGMSAEQLRTAVEQMDPSTRVAWRKK